MCHAGAAPLGTRHAVPRPATGNRRLARHGRPRLFQTKLINIRAHPSYPRRSSIPASRANLACACIRPAHAEARRRGDRERSSHKVLWTGLYPSLETHASRATARRRRWGHGMPCPDLQPETGASCATPGRCRWGHGMPRPNTCRRKRALRVPRQTQTIPDKTHQHPCPSVASVPIRVLFQRPRPARSGAERHAIIAVFKRMGRAVLAGYVEHL